MTRRWRNFVKLGFVALIAGGCLAVPQTAVRGATADNIIIRDEEIERDLHKWTTGIIHAAGMDPSQVNLVLIQSPEVNAFVAGGANIFIYTGLIQKTDNADQVIGVIAHELGHIAGGHLTRTREEMRNASFESIIGALLGIGAAVASGDGSAAAAGIQIGQAQAINKYLAHSRVQESSADQAGFRFMTGAGLDPEGLPGFLEKLSSDELLPADQQSQYARTHPLSQDRVVNLQSKVNASSLKGKPLPAAWNNEYKRIKAKLMGFITPQQVVYAYPSTDTSIEAAYARAIAAYRMNHVDEALSLTKNLISREPENPYFHELMGQELYDFGRVKESIPYYRKAIGLLPDAGLIRIAYARSLIESAGKSTAPLDEAIAQLKRAELEEPRASGVKRLLATAYGKLGQESKARVYLAEEALMQGRRKEAVQMAKASLKQLPAGSPERLRAQDIINAVGDAGKTR